MNDQPRHSPAPVLIASPPVPPGLKISEVHRHRFSTLARRIHHSIRVPRITGIGQAVGLGQHDLRQAPLSGGWLQHAGTSTHRVCHFAHHPGPDGHPHLCGRQSQGVSSVDHLYVRSATIAWLRDRNEQADFDFAPSQGAPIGSVVDIRVKHAGLSLYLDQSVEPA